MTIQDILTAAYAKSKKNQPERIATEETELVGVVNRVFRTNFMRGVRVNPYWFGVDSVVSFSSPGWARPPKAEAVFRIEIDASTEVIVVPFQERAVEPTIPAVYRYNQVYRSAGNPSDPTSGDLTFFYSSRPTDVADLTTALDTRFPEAYRELLVVETAIYLAIKDQREDEVAALGSERDQWLLLYLAFLEHETMNEVGIRHIEPFSTPSVIPIASLLTGGSEVELP